MNDQEYNYLKAKIYKLTNLDINCYKIQQMRRRLDAFVAKHNYPTIAAYCTMLENNPDKQREFLDYMAINVSEFFRDTAQFKILKTLVLPQLLKNNSRLNIWSAACSCGQEPYSLAMILDEISFGNHRILATDIDESALTQARNGGPYLTYEMRNVEAGFLAKNFTNNEKGYWINDRIKKKVTFKRHNLLSDPFEQNFDLIVCRNVIIYFAEAVRDDLYRKFHRSLKADGTLFLGGSEVVLKPGDQGYCMLHPSFYRKMAVSPVKAKVVSEFSEVSK